MTDGYTVLGSLKIVLSNRGLGINGKKCLYEGVVIAPTSLFGEEAFDMRCAWKGKVNVLKMKYLRRFG